MHLPPYTSAAMHAAHTTHTAPHTPPRMPYVATDAASCCERARLAHGTATHTASCFKHSPHRSHPPPRTAAHATHVATRHATHATDTAPRCARPAPPRTQIYAASARPPHRSHPLHVPCHAAHTATPHTPRTRHPTMHACVATDTASACPPLTFTAAHATARGTCSVLLRGPTPCPAASTRSPRRSHPAAPHIPSSPLRAPGVAHLRAFGGGSEAAWGAFVVAVHDNDGRGLSPFDKASQCGGGVNNMWCVRTGAHP
ncbi:hypothetical protein GGX14DRAFT_559111 [Mycena pura]|uniref:Uncharacterized protein n=1 Tax=Mycena pura TaxID=153505 RepID=A0AAD6VST6_9AGAR|nr:hypothetical protein GGX14DRAFT_559111 [Mycena pura]